MLLSQIFDEKIEACSIELMASYGVTLEVVAASSGNRVNTGNRTAIVGYSGGLIPSGNLALWIDPVTLEKTGPEPGETSDWLSELSNQLMGRILNKLLTYGIELMQSTPVVVNANMLDIQFFGGRTKHYQFIDDSRQTVMIVFFEASFDREQKIEPQTTDSSTLAEGESIIF